MYLTLRSVWAMALGAIAVIVVLDSHQQSGQQFLHHAGQLTTGHQRS